MQIRKAILVLNTDENDQILMALILEPEAVSYADLQSPPCELQLKQLELDTFGDFHSSSLVPFCSEP